MESRNEAHVVLLAQAGDRSALDQLFRLYQGRLFERVRLVTGDPDLSADVLQEVFILLQRKLSHLKDPRFFGAWANRIAVREAVRQVRKARKRDAVQIDLSTIPDGRATDPLDTIAAAQMAEYVTLLPAASRVVLILHYLDELPISEVADVLRIPVGTVKSRLGFGLKRLREILGRSTSQSTHPS